jgi:NSS family neurotransmitter:Na+ symporter
MEKREQWGTRLGFILAAVGSAVGLGNIWRFPYQAYTHGGGTFLIPYFIAMLTAGIPILILEFSLGHRFRGGAPTVFGRLSLKQKGLSSFEWLGWLQVLVSIIIATYYAVIVAWTISYTFLSITGAWGTDTADFFFNKFLKVSDGALTLGGINFPILAGIAFVWGAGWLILFRGIKGGIEKANKVFMPTLIVLLLVLTIRSVFLDGAAIGLDWLFKPDFSKLGDLNVWTAAYGQIFYSMSIGFAIMITYSSYLPKKSDIVNNGFMTGLLNCGFSMISGIMIFAILGNMANTEGVGVDEVVSGGIGLAFVTIPKAINYMPLPFILGPLFFLSLTIAGMSSSISINETIITSFVDRFNLNRKKTVTVFCFLGFLASSLYATGAGIFILDIVDHYINDFGILIGGLLEVLLLGWVFKLNSQKEYFNPLSDFKVGSWWNLCLKVLTPLVLLSMAVSNFAGELGEVTYENYPQLAVLIFGRAMLVLIVIIAFGIYHGALHHSGAIKSLEEME